MTHICCALVLADEARCGEMQSMVDQQTYKLKAKDLPDSLDMLLTRNYSKHTSVRD